MSKDLKNGEFYADGDRVMLALIEVQKPDGSTNATLGLHVCTAAPYVSDGAAEVIAKALNNVEAAEKLRAAIEHVLAMSDEYSSTDALAWLRDWNEGDETAMRELDAFIADRGGK